MSTPARSGRLRFAYTLSKDPLIKISIGLLVPGVDAEGIISKTLPPAPYLSLVRALILHKFAFPVHVQDIPRHVMADARLEILETVVALLGSDVINDCF